MIIVIILILIGTFLRFKNFRKKGSVDKNIKRDLWLFIVQIASLGLFAGLTQDSLVLLGIFYVTIEAMVANQLFAKRHFK
ncbi:hypothetical protein MED297_06454 [Reinekea sp. MED297]|uniref:Uncharacterized protein n=1 Tax=Reinekea blandensis MED297 TaxID=314283 RepID=A4BJL9_9GAMM|nr:hypothetical protein MED297_06454 [Reinekea sp. MED297] [Reinekea blandensis MED297]